MGVGFNDLHPQQPPSLIFFNACMVLERTTCAADVPSQSQRNKLQELGGVVSCVVTAPSALLCLFLLFCFALLRFYSHHHPALRTSPPASGNLIHQKDGIQRCTCTHPRITDLPTSYLHCCSTAARRRKSMPLHKARERQRASHPGPDRRRRTHHNHLVRLPAAGTPNTRSSTPPLPPYVPCMDDAPRHVTTRTAVAVRRRTEAEEGKDISPAMGRARQPRTFSGKKKKQRRLLVTGACCTVRAHTEGGAAEKKREGRPKRENDRCTVCHAHAAAATACIAMACGVVSSQPDGGRHVRRPPPRTLLMMCYRFFCG